MTRFPLSNYPKIPIIGTKYQVPYSRINTKNELFTIKRWVTLSWTHVANNTAIPETFLVVQWLRFPASPTGCEPDP